MATSNHTKYYSATDLSQMELANELTRLNASLKVELQKCYKYIETLQRDLHDLQERNNLSLASERTVCFGEGVEQEQNKLKEEVGRLSAKVKQKRSLAKSLQKHCQGLEVHLNQCLKEKEQLQVTLSNMQYLLESRMSQDRDKISKLQKIAAEQTDTIQLSTRQLQSKTAINQKLIIKIQDFEKQRITSHQQIEQLKQINSSLTQKVRHLERTSQEREFQASFQIQELQNKILSLNDQVSKLNASISRTDLFRKSSLSTIDGSSKVWPVTKRIAAEQHSVVEHMEIQRLHLLNQIQSIQEEKQNEKQKVEKLKNDIITIKLEHSNLLTKNTQLYQQKSKLEKIKNELAIKLQGGNTMRSVNQTERSYEGNSFYSLKSSGNKTIGSMGSTSAKRPFNSPQDGQIPVLDKGSIKGKYIYMSSSAADSRKNGLSHRQSTINFTSFR